MQQKQQQPWWLNDAMQELNRIYGDPAHGIAAPAAVRREPQQGMSRLSSVLPVQTDPPRELFWTCDVCGVVAPLQTFSGRWIRREHCACESKKREAAREAEEFRQWNAAQIYRTFGGWLGTGWTDTKLAAKTLANFERKEKWQREAWQRVNGWLAGDMTGNLLFHGSFGTGKTHLAVAICNALREKRITSLFVSAPKYFAARNDLIKHDGDYHRLDKLAIITPLLVLDDCDKAHHTDSREEAYWLIVDERAKAGRPTVVTCNDMGKLLATYGQAAFSRLMAGVKSIEMTGTDYRAK